ncbi:hypothetical protein BDV10DRAFT_166963 [Aspergillus recurvatus]
MSSWLLFVSLPLLAAVKVYFVKVPVAISSQAIRPNSSVMIDRSLAWPLLYPRAEKTLEITTNARPRPRRTRPSPSFRQPWSSHPVFLTGSTPFSPV